MDSYFMFLVTINSFIMLLVFTYLFSVYRARYLGFWCLGGALIMVKLGIDFILLGAEQKILMMPLPIKLFDQFTVIAAAYFWTLGTCSFTGRTISRLAYLFFAGAAWSIIGVFTARTFLWLNLPAFLLFGLSFIWMGKEFYYYPRVDWFGKKITGLFLMLWGVHFIEYPFNREMVWLAPFGYYLTAVFAFVSCLGALFIYFFRAQNELLESEERFRLLAENARDILYRFTGSPQICFEYISPAVEKIIGYTPEEIYASAALLEGIKPTDKPDILRVVHKDNREVWLEQRNVAIRDSKGTLIAYEGIARDITEAKEQEKHLQYLSFRDSLTGLGNRLQFENELKGLETKKVAQVAIILCDIDGLKFANDSKGHLYGDKLIIATAAVIKTGLPEHACICRIGGDEFAIILPNYTRAQMQESEARLREELSRHNNETPELPLSVSIGSAQSDKGGLFAYNLFVEADARMYQEKLRKSAAPIIYAAGSVNGGGYIC